MSRMPVRTVLVVVLVAVAVAGGIAAGAAPPHTHGDVPGLYNQEHDLTAFATLGSAAALAETADVRVVASVVSPLPGLAVVPTPGRALRTAPSRAPPRA